jgi:hypothetical protein
MREKFSIGEILLVSKDKTAIVLDTYYDELFGGTLYSVLVDGETVIVDSSKLTKLTEVQEKK